MGLDKKTIDRIRADFPDASIQVKKGFKDPETGKQQYLVGYKPQYIIERMNDVFGHEGWDYVVLEHEIEGSEAWALGQLTVYTCKHDIDAIDGPLVRKIMTVKQQFGTGSYNRGTSLGDAKKSAATNAFEKCASMLDVGHKAYKGLEKPPEEHPKSEEMKIEDSKEQLIRECKTHKIDKGAFKVLVKTVLKEEKEIGKINTDEMKLLIEHLKKNESPF